VDGLETVLRDSYPKGTEEIEGLEEGRLNITIYPILIEGFAGNVIEVFRGKAGETKASLTLDEPVKGVQKLTA
jgi:hypothetical protein